METAMRELRDHTQPGSGACLDRRAFNHLAALAGGALLSAVDPLAAYAGGNAKVVMLSCRDYRLVDDLVAAMSEMGLQDNYNPVVLAVASLGVVNDKFADRHDRFWQHLDVAKQLHHIEQVIVIDHRDCGAYKPALGESAVS